MADKIAESDDQLAKAREEVRHLETLARAKEKHGRGERLTHEERVELEGQWCVEQVAEIRAKMRELRVADERPAQFTIGHYTAIIIAMEMLAMEMRGISVSHADKRQALEDRIEQLEKRGGGSKKPKAKGA